VLLNTPDASTTKGLRDRAILAVLLGCGLRRSEVAALNFGHIQQRDGRWCIVDLLGKHGRVRTIPMPAWVKVAIDAWTSAAGVSDGQVFRAVDRGDQVRGTALSEKVVWQLLQGYATAAGVPGIAPIMPHAALPTHLRQALSNSGRRTGTDPIASRSRVDPNHRKVPWHQAGFDSCTQRRDQTHGSARNPRGTGLRVMSVIAKILHPRESQRPLLGVIAKNNRSKSACACDQRKRLDNQAVWPVIFGLTGPICARALKLKASQ